MLQCKRLNYVIVFFAAMWASSATTQAGSLSNGAKIYQRHCIICHGANGQPTDPGTPNFVSGFTQLKPDPVLAKIISVGKKMMPAYVGVLKRAEIADVIVYIRTLR